MKMAEDYNAELADTYASAIEKLKTDVEAWYVRFGKENDVSLADARRILDHRELKAFRLTLKEYIKLAKQENLPADYQKMLENASIRVRLTKSQEIYVRMLDYVTRLAHQQETGLASVLKQAYEDAVYKNAYETQSMQRNFRGFDRVPEDTINTVIHKPWARDGKDFSARIWENRDTLINNLQTELTQSLMAQEGTAPLTARLAKRMNVSYSNAKRLVETETAYIQEKASLDAYSRLGVEQYQILATLDSRTSETCRHLDGKVFDKKDAKPGITMPPFHCYCRTTTIPYIKGITDEDTTRTARDPETGKTAFVEGDLTYPKWYNKYVRNTEADSLVGMMADNGIKISGLSKHQQERADMRKLNVDGIEDALVNPLFVRDVVIDSDGRPSQRFIGRTTTVNINPDTGVIVTSWKTGAKTCMKYSKGEEK